MYSTTAVMCFLKRFYFILLLHTNKNKYFFLAVDNRMDTEN